MIFQPLGFVRGGKDLVAQHDVIDDVRLSHRLADELGRGESGDAEEDQADGQSGERIMPGLR